MNLIPFSKEFLKLNEALPFGLRDAGGRLLLAAGSKVDREDRLAELRHNDLFADELESSEWRRRLGSAMSTMILQNASLQKISDARPVAEAPPKTVRELGVGEQWTELSLVLEAALRDVRPDAPWMNRLTAVHERALRFAERRPDASLYHLIFTAGSSTERYSSNHALLCMQIARAAAITLGWDAALLRSLDLAALTMNVSMRRLQDLLAAGDPHITPDMRTEILEHPLRSVAMLEAGGVTDPVWLEIVRLHHDDSGKDQALAELTPARQAARLLRRVDVFTAKLSRRVSRAPMSPVQAAREACLGATGKPDEIGSALLKSVGLYPPGSFVSLVSGELGIVIARGRLANMPIVAALVSVSGNPLAEPPVRDTLDKRHAVKAAVSAQSVRVRPPHEKLMAMR